MNCPECNNSMQLAVSKCEIGFYNIVDKTGKLLWQWQSHDLLSNDPEIGSEVDCEHCQACGVVIHLSQ